MPIPRPVRDFLADAPFAHVVTLDPDGWPRVSLAWAGIVDDDLVFASFTDQKKLENLRRDPRVTLSFEADEPGGEFLHPYLVIRGTAEVLEGGALPVMDVLAEGYIGAGQHFPNRDVPPGFVVRVTPDRYYGQGPWKRALEAERGRTEGESAA